MNDCLSVNSVLHHSLSNLTECIVTHQASAISMWEGLKHDTRGKELHNIISSKLICDLHGVFWYKGHWTCHIEHFTIYPKILSGPNQIMILVDYRSILIATRLLSYVRVVPSWKCAFLFHYIYLCCLKNNTNASLEITLSVELNIKWLFVLSQCNIQIKKKLETKNYYCYFQYTISRFQPNF